MLSIGFGRNVFDLYSDQYFPFAIAYFYTHYMLPLLATSMCGLSHDSSEVQSRRTLQQEQHARPSQRNIAILFSLYTYNTYS